MSQFKTIASYRDLPLAELAKAKLMSQGIYCHLLNAHHIGMNWLYSQALGGIKVQVRSEDAEIARKILARDESYLLNDEELEFPDPDENDACPRCGSLDIELVKQSRFFGALALLTHLPLLFWGTRYRCRDCGYKMTSHLS